MGLYLFVIAITDMIFRDNYNRVASSWMSSWFCTFVGVMAMTSLEVHLSIVFYKQNSDTNLDLQVLIVKNFNSNF